MVQIKKEIGEATVTYNVCDHHITLSSDKATIVADGVDKAIITATLFDYKGNPYNYNGTVTFSVDGTTLDIQAVNGKATTTVQATTKSTINVITINKGMGNGEVVVDAV